MLTTSTVKGILRKPWWTLVKNEVARAIAIRTKAADDFLKPHGSVLGQAFVDLMNELPDLREYVHYLTTRGWPELISDIESDLSTEMQEALRHEEGAAWYQEFQKFLLEAWASSIPKASEEEAFRIISRKTYAIAKTEFKLHVERGITPGVMASAILELMRDSANDVTRKAATLSCTFLAARTWPEVLVALAAKFSEDLKEFDTPKAAAYFETLKVMMLSQVEEFWDGSVAQKKSRDLGAPEPA